MICRWIDQKKILHAPYFRHQQDGDTMIGMGGLSVLSK
jgi:hypothetical protein